MRSGMIARPWFAATSVFIAAFLTILVLLDLRINMFDEGLVLVDALRTMNGDVVHRDYYSPYAPASYYLLAALFSLNAHYFIVARLYGAAWMAGIVAITYRLLSDWTRPGLAIGFTLICLAWMIGLPFYLYPTFPCLFLTLLGTFLLLRWVERRKGPALLLAGCTAGVATLFRYDSSVFQTIAHVSALAVLIWANAVQGPKLATFASAAAVYCCGAAAVFVPFALLYLWIAPLSGVWNDVVDYPLHYYAAMRGLPFPRGELLHHPSAVAVYVPFLAVLLGLAEIVRSYRATPRSGSPAQREHPDRDTIFLMVLTVVTAILIYKGTVRVSMTQMITALVPASLVLALIAERTLRDPTRSRTFLAIVLATIAVPAALKAGAQVGETYTARASLLVRLLAPRGAPATSCPSHPVTTLAIQPPDYQATAEFLRRNSLPDEPVFVGLDRHDRIFANPVALYFLAERRPATHWHQFDPGMQTRADIQRKMIRDLEQSGVRWLVRDAAFSGSREPNKSAVSSGVHFLDDYLAANYRRVKQFGSLEMWLRNGETAPPGLRSPACRSGST